MAWDTEFALDRWFSEIFRVCKPDAPIIIFSAQPFTSRLISTCPKFYKYSWFWIKNKASLIQGCGKQPIRKIEEIAVFYRNFREYHPPTAKFDVPRKYRISHAISKIYGGKEFTKAGEYYEVTHKTQTNILEFDVVSNKDKLVHTQKPIDLVKFFLETYTKENDLVLDSFVGSGTTGAACVELNRKFIGIERDELHWKIAADRISK